MTAILAAVVITSTVFAGAIKLSRISFSLGSLIADGVATGLGKADALELELQASGHASVICTNHGENDVPGQSSPHVDGSGKEALPGDSGFSKNGKSDFSVTADSEVETNPYISWEEGGCPNPNWTARIDFVYWEDATIMVKDTETLDENGDPVTIKTYHYACTTTRIPSTDPNDDYTFDDGTVSCTLVNVE